MSGRIDAGSGEPYRRGRLRLVWIPRLAGCVPNVNDPRVVSFDAPVNQIGVAADRQYAGIRLAGGSAGLGKLADQFDRPAERPCNISSASWALPLDISQNGNNVSARTRSIANPHGPKRCQSASISASGTNSPRRACSSPSRIAARASSSSGTTPAPSSVIARRTAASVSCSSGGSARACSIAFSRSLVMCLVLLPDGKISSNATDVTGREKPAQ